MEKNKKNKKLMIIIIILFVLVIGLSTYIVYEKIASKSENEINNTNNNDKKDNNKIDGDSSEKNTIVNQEIKEDYNKSKKLTEEEDRYIVLEEEKGKYMVLMKDDYQYLMINKAGVWIELEKTKTDSLAYKVIATTEKAIYYITYRGALVSESLIDDHSGGMIYGEISTVDNYYASALTKTNLYVEFYEGDDYRSYGIIDFELDENGMIVEAHDDMVSRNEPIDFQILNNKIYMLEAYNGCDSDLKVYDISTKETKKIKENICQLNIVGNEIIIGKSTNNEVYYEFYTMDPKTLKTEHIINAENLVQIKNVAYFESDNNIDMYIGGDLEPQRPVATQARIIDYDNNNIYYLRNNTIYSHNRITSDILYKGDSKTEIVFYNVLGEDQIQVFTEKEYYNILNGKKVDKNEFKSSFPSYKITNTGTGKAKTYKVIDVEYYEPYDKN